MTPDFSPFKDRREAGAQLAAALMYLKKDSPVVLALPRGGVPVAYEVAQALGAPLDVLLVRKIGAPGFPELGLGAVVDGQRHQRVINEELVNRLRPPPGYLEAEEQRQLDEIERRRKIYCGDRPPVPIQGRTVIVVDDGIATGGTMGAALKALAREGVAKLIFAVPVAPRSALDSLCAVVDDGVCLFTQSNFQAVGQYYKNFEQTTDEEVIVLLDAAANESGELGAGTEVGAIPPDAVGGQIPPDASIPGKPA
ncbi:phosphoribosyltransferase [Herbaspirillum sp. GCM10030257]|uniref:phosphoribosyltransferase n=1 Tax=Herbaspirillum sp. GCM10030257 TaxID=3273393 RepID=UPI00361CD022